MSKTISIDERIAALEIELKRLSLEIKKLKDKRQKEKTTKGFVKGCSAKVTNKYKGEEGTVGLVIKVTPLFVTILTKDGRQIKRSKNNMKVV